MIPLFFLLLAAGGADADTRLLEPADAIALADVHRERGSPGTFKMKVAAAERTPYALYLNSSVDYRSPDDVTFHLTPSAAKTLEKRLGAKPEVALIGKTVTVSGEIRAVPIANTVNGQARSLNRYQHTVLVREAARLAIQ
ncbi:hypothetical protein Q4F19_19230 [Sphingomonas sp. BIUV-7]|uniref:Preprotein translocase subunit SecD n=1 Tax=Sphingomonas natans TaxID=3063330 RepID=A0ABT8YDW5_9SPHN|nr:hypothetical protein [Sphingomonas sp. BIUV-7]MDO6416524.1 hypothetical protein [Sphingomonas sp. BIUV-7]